MIMSPKLTAGFIKILKWLVISLCTIIGLTAVYFWLTYTDVTITQGKRYGAAIGQSKPEVFSSLKSFNSASDVYILHPIDETNFGVHRKIDFTEGDYDILKNRETWELYFSYGDYSNFLRLRFDADNKLTEIYRHKQAFELP